jgi:hypothetical protein
MLSLAPDTVSPMDASVPVLELERILLENSEPFEVALESDASPVDCPDAGLFAILPPADISAGGLGPAGAKFWNIDRTGKTNEADVDAVGESGTCVHDAFELEESWRVGPGLAFLDDEGATPTPVPLTVCAD